jgi:WD40 repeat protein
MAPAGKYLVTVYGNGNDNTAKRWNLKAGKADRTFNWNGYAIDCLAVSPDGRYLAIGEPGHYTARLWNLESGKEIRAFNNKPNNEISSLVFTPDSKYLVVGCYDNRNEVTEDGVVYDCPAKLWDISTGKEIREFKGHSRAVNSVAITRDGKFLATGSDDKTAKLWDLATGRMIKAFKGHTSYINSLAISADGKYIVTGSYDGTTRFWDMETGAELCRLVSFDAGWVATTPEGSFDGSAGGIKKLCWKVGLKKLPVNTFSKKYYVPGLLNRMLAGNN